MEKLFRLLAIVTALNFSLSVFGQEVAKLDTTFSKNKVERSTTLVFGPNFSQFVTSVSSGTTTLSTKSGRIAAFHFGYTDVIKYNSKWAFKTGVNVSIEPYVKTTANVYSCVPIQAQYFVNSWFSVVAGCDLDFYLFTLYEGNILNDNSIDKWWNPSLSFGIETKLNKTFKIYANYNAGLNNILSSNYTSMTKDVIQVGIGILLKKK